MDDKWTIVDDTTADKTVEDIKETFVDKPKYSLLLPEETLVLPRTPTTPISKTPTPMSLTLVLMSKTPTPISKTPTPISKTPTPMLEVPTPMSPISFNVLSNSLINHKEDLENITHELYDVKDNMAVLQNKLSISYSLIGLVGILGFAVGFILNKK